VVHNTAVHAQSIMHQNFERQFGLRADKKMKEQWCNPVKNHNWACLVQQFLKTCFIKKELQTNRLWYRFSEIQASAKE